MIEQRLVSNFQTVHMLTMGYDQAITVGGLPL